MIKYNSLNNQSNNTSRFLQIYSVEFCIQWFVMIIFSQVMLIIYKIMIIQFINYDSIDKINKDMIIFESKIYQQSLNENIGLYLEHVNFEI